MRVLAAGGGFNITQIYFASSPRADLLEFTFGPWDWVNNPLNILVAFPFVDVWHAENEGEGNNWPTKANMLDSGAYSAWSAGKHIDMDALCTEASKPCWDEVVALDVIGDAEKSMVNSLEMKSRGLTVMPVFHFGDPWEILQEYKAQFNRIGIASGHGAPLKERLRWTAQCFARAYPAKFHSFGWVKREVLLQFPFVTADSSSWAMGTRFGVSKMLPGVKIPKKSQVGQSNADLRFDIIEYLKLQSELEERWATELAWAQPHAHDFMGLGDTCLQCQT